MQTGILTTLPFTRHRDAIERQRARDGIAKLNDLCPSIGANWHVYRKVFHGRDKSDTIWVHFADGRAFYMDVDLPEDYATAADHAAAFIATPMPDSDRFDDVGHGMWTNLYV